MEGHFTVIYHAKHTPKASNLLTKWPSDLSNCRGAVSKWCPYKAVGCYFLVCALCISIQQMSKLILQPNNSLPCGLLHWQQHICEIVSSLLRQRIGMIHGWGETSIAIDLPAIQGNSITTPVFPAPPPPPPPPLASVLSFSLLPSMATLPSLVFPQPSFLRITPYFDKQSADTRPWHHSDWNPPPPPPGQPEGRSSSL